MKKRLVLGLVLVVCSGACRKQPTGVVVTGPILGMTVATAFDDTGHAQKPGFAFAPTEPQVMVIVQVGRLDPGASQVRRSRAPFIHLATAVAAAPADSVVTIAWYRISDESEQRLFEHQVKVKSYERAYSIGKSKGTLKAGSYKVKATLAGQTQETELEVRSPNTARSSMGGGDDAGPGEPPVDGGSGIVAGSSGASATSSSGTDPVSGDCATDLTPESTRADEVTISVARRCPKTAPAASHVVVAWLQGERGESKIGTLVDVPGALVLTDFRVNPCLLDGSKDLPGTGLGLMGGDDVWFDYTRELVLGPDQDTPKVSVNSTPPKGTKVKAGDVIKIDATASERRKGGTWQTGVQRFQLVRTSPGKGIEELIQEVTDPSRLPKPCEKKSWSKVLDASYKVPDNPPPVIKLCAIAEDYAGNEGIKCGEFPTGDVWEGTINNQITAYSPAGTCTEKHQYKIEIVAGDDGRVSGTISTVEVGNNNCSGTPQYGIVGMKWPVAGGVNDAGFTFSRPFVGEPQGMTVQGSTFIQKSGRNQASGMATTRYSFEGGNHAHVMQVEMKCKTCPTVAR